MKKLLIILITILSPTSNYPQYYKYFLENNYAFNRIGLPIENLSGFGLSNILSNVSNLSTLNPASLENINEYSIGISYEYSSSIELNTSLHAVLNTEVKRPVTPMPQSMGFVVPYSNFRFGIAMNKYYNVELTANDWVFAPPIDLSDVNKRIYRARIERYSAIASYSLPNINLSVGFGLNLNSFYQDEKYDMYSSFHPQEYEYKDPLYTNNWHLGALYKFSFPNDKYIKLALAYESNFKFDNQMKLITGTGYNITDITTKLSSRLKVDAEFKVKENLRLLASLSEASWKSVYEDSENSISGSFGGLIKLSRKTVFSLGFSISNGTSYGNLVEKNANDVLFIYAGVNSSYKFLNFDLAVADSHIPYDKLNKQTIIKFALGFMF